jgi:hypothetical protein
MPKTKTVIIYASLFAFLSIPASFFFCGSSFLQFETKRFAKFESDGSILFVVKGFHACPLTPEGPFPEWSNTMRAYFNSPSSLRNANSGEFNLGSDFSSQYGALKSGHISIDRSTNSIVLSGEYSDSYNWSRAIGKFPISD